MYNSITLIGHLGKDPEIRTTESGTTIVTFSVATSETWKNEKGEKIKHTEWHNVVFFGWAETFKKYAHTGQLIMVVGQLRTSEYKDKDNKTHKVTKVIGSTFRFLKDKEIAKQLADNEQIPNNGSNEIDDDIPF